MSDVPKRPCSSPHCPHFVIEGRCASCRRKYEETRPHAFSRAWYRSPRWQALRRAALRAQPFCSLCEVEGRRRATTDADHIEPHRGSPELFWNPANIQALCHAHHSAKTQSGA